MVGGCTPPPPPPCSPVPTVLQRNTSMVDKKRHLMILTKGYYVLIPAGNVSFRVDINKAGIIY